MAEEGRGASADRLGIWGRFFFCLIYFLWPKKPIIKHMQYGKDYILSMKERYELARSKAFAAAADAASRKYGVPILKLPMELIRSIGASDVTVVAALDAWQKAILEHDDSSGETGESWGTRLIPGYSDNGGSPLSIDGALTSVGDRLNHAEQTILSIVQAITINHADDRPFWMGVVMETATLVRVEAGLTLTILNDIAQAAEGHEKDERIRKKQEHAKVLRDDARSLIDLAKAHLGVF